MTRVAVTGFGVVSPIGVGREAFWASLRNGHSGIGPISRFDCSGLDVRLAGEVREPIELPENAMAIAADDPKVGFAYAACREALSQAGIGRLGAGCLLHLGASLEVFPWARAFAGATAGLATISERLGRFKLPLDAAVSLIGESFGRPVQALTNCSACAAGSQAIGHGFRAVRSGRYAVVLCGGFDSMLNVMGVAGFQALGALTLDNDRGARACRPFDSGRGGTVLGEGAAALVLEPLEKARADGRKVLGEICGYGSSLDAHHPSAPDANGDGAARAMAGALADAGIEPAAVSHINAHGTGTRLNDEIEAAAIRRVFAGCWHRIPVSATKSMTGHLIAAAGAVEAGACLLATARGWLPPNPSLDNVGARCELCHVVGEAAPFPGEYAVSNSFGFGGQNASLVFRRIDGIQ